MSLVSLKTIIESLLFVSEGPLMLTDIERVVPEADKDEIREAVKELIEETEAGEHAYMLYEVARGWEYRTREEFAPYLRKLTARKPTKLSKAALDCLSIIAYKGPLTRAQMEDWRGVDSGAVLRTLMDKRLVKTAGPLLDAPGQPQLYRVSRDFLEVFGLKNLKDLPSLSDIRELMPEDEQLGFDGFEQFKQKLEADREAGVDGESEQAGDADSPAPGELTEDERTVDPEAGAELLAQSFSELQAGKEERGEPEED